MADKSISELTAVTTVNSDDCFVLQQNARAMKLTGQILLNWLATALDGHGGINNIAKSGTSVLVDTYTITFADETTTTFTVTNGKSISSISLTGTSGLVDTYTIAFNDGTSQTFTVTNGKGITSIAKTGTSSLVDTYTITYNNGATQEYTITNGRSISSVTKTGTLNLVDTYTITYNDSTTSTFDITNGNGIASVIKTSSGLTDTYTITYDDATTYAFDVDNGNGIDSIQKSTSGLVDTYTINYTNGNSYQFTVTNGVSIVSVAKTSTVGLVDTYTITYNDSTTSTFTVTNGEKGDKGDNTYTWIKYSAVEPQRDSDMQDLPEAWIGIYAGSSATAPTHYTDYTWYMMKGAQGNPGADITIASATTQYASSTSGTQPPTIWQNAIPTVEQSHFLWTKTEVVYSTGDSTLSYAVSRQGKDGTGSVSSVQGQSPDSNGNIHLYDIIGTKLILA